MWWTERVERLDRRWTIDDLGCHVQFGDLLEEIVDDVQENYGLFTGEELGEALDTVLTDADGDDLKSVKVTDVRAAVSSLGA
jgi:hypothetical protein